MNKLTKPLSCNCFFNLPTRNLFALFDSCWNSNNRTQLSIYFSLIWRNIMCVHLKRTLVNVVCLMEQKTFASTCKYTIGLREALTPIWHHCFSTGGFKAEFQFCFAFLAINLFVRPQLIVHFWSNTQISTVWPLLRRFKKEKTFIRSFPFHLCPWWCRCSIFPYIT